MMYIQDYDETYQKALTFPACDMGSLGTNYGSWYVLLLPYIKNSQIFVCPSLSKNGSTSTYTVPALGIGFAKVGYGWNIGTSTASYHDGFGYYYGDGQPYRNAANIEKPAETVLIGGISIYDNWLYLTWRDGIPSALPDVHNDGGNYVFADGHAKWMSQTNAYGAKGLFTVADD